jgi:hypothetical protein
MALPLTQDFEEGTNGTTITTANSGGGSPSSSAFDAVTITNSATCVFSTAQAAHGTLCAAFTTSATAGTSYLGWTASIGGAQAVLFGRVYVYLTAYPVADSAIVSFANSGFGGGIMVTAAGALCLQNAASGEVASGVTLPLGQWFRLEFQIVAGTAGAATANVNYYSSPDSATVAGGVSDAAGAYGVSGGISNVNWGWTASNASQPTLYLDCLQINITGYPGPQTGGATLPGAPARAAAAAMPGAPRVTGAPVGIAGQWSGSWAPPDGFEVLDSAVGTVRASVANTGTAGNWMIAVWSARQIPGQPAITAAIGDDAHNYWEPLGAPNGTSPASGATRCGIWAARSPGQAGTVFMSRSGGTAASACLIVFEVSGLSPWETLTGIVAGTVAAVGTLTLDTLPAPGASALAVSACTVDVLGPSLTVGGPGWSALAPVTATDGFDLLSDLTLAASWKVTTASVATTWTMSGPLSGDMAAVTAVVLVLGVPPVPAAPDWPMVQFQAAFGGGALTPWDQLAWTDLTSRYRGMTTQRGKQYELDTVQSGTVTFTLSNNDGWLTPGSPTSPYAVAVYTPVRVLVTWPPPPSPNAVTYVPFRGFMERWPQSLTSTRYQVTGAVATDVWALLTSLAQTAARAEILADSPWAYWPGGDPAGDVTVQNIAPGSTAVMRVLAAKAGAAAAAVAVFGASTTLTVLAAVSPTLQSTLTGDPGSTCWSQTGLGAGDGGNGYTLQCQAAGAPSLINGVTFEGWFSVADTVQPTTELSLMSIGGPPGTMYQLYLDANGYININQWNSTTRALQSTVIDSTKDWSNGAWFHLAVTITQTNQQPYINGLIVAGAPSVFLDTAWYALSYNGQNNRWGSGAMYNGTVYGMAVFTGSLSSARIATHYWAAVAALAGSDTADQRIERLLTEAQSGFPRCITTSPDVIQGAVDQQGQQLATNLINIAESDGGLLFVDGPGYICYQSRAAGYNLPVTATLGENASPVPVMTGIVTRPSAFSLIAGPTPLPAGVYLVSWTVILAGTPGGADANNFLLNLNGPGNIGFINEWPSVNPGAAGAYPQPTATVTVPSGGGALTLLSSSHNATAGTIYAGSYTGEYSYLPDIAFDYDPSQVYNDIQLTQLAAPQAVNGAAVSVVVTPASTAAVATSIEQYGDQTLQETVYLADPGAVGDLANWIFWNSSYPLLRISQLTLDPGSNPALWPVVLSLEVGQVYQVNRRLMGTQIIISGLFQLMSVAHSTAGRTWTVKITLVTYPGQVLTADDPVRGQLSGLYSLGW